MALFDQLSVEQTAVLTILGCSVFYLFLVDPLWDVLVRARQQRPIDRDMAAPHRLLETRLPSLDVAVPASSLEPPLSPLSSHLNGLGFDKGRDLHRDRYSIQDEARWRTPADSGVQPYRGGDAA